MAKEPLWMNVPLEAVTCPIDQIGHEHFESDDAALKFIWDRAKRNTLCHGLISVLFCWSSEAFTVIRLDSLFRVTKSTKEAEFAVHSFARAVASADKTEGLAIFLGYKEFSGMAFAERVALLMESRHNKEYTHVVTALIQRDADGNISELVDHNPVDCSVRPFLQEPIDKIGSGFFRPIH